MAGRGRLGSVEVAVTSALRLHEHEQPGEGRNPGQLGPVFAVTVMSRQSVLEHN
jgi:hypothetical protein